jgi:hypothetical protein
MVFGFDVVSTTIHTTFYVKKIGKKMTVTIFKMIRKVKKWSRLPLSTGHSHGIKGILSRT